MGSRSRAWRRVRLLAAAPILLLSGAACDPCFGVAGCVGEARLALEGELIEQGGDEPKSGVAGVEITFVRTGGVGLEDEPVRGLTDREGRFLLRARAAGEGWVEGTLSVHPPDRAGYSIPLELPTTRRRGEGVVLPLWAVRPYFPYVGELHLRGSGAPLRGADVEFRRLGGVELSGPGWVEGRYRTRADGAGRVLLMEGVYPEGAGEVVGVLTVTPIGGAPHSTSELRLSSTHLAYDDYRIVRLGVGPSLFYLGELHDEVGRPAEGIRVEYRWTGGIRVTPEAASFLTDAEGRFPLVLQASEAGEATAELRITPAGANPMAEVIPIRIPTFDSDEVRLLGVWAIGGAGRIAAERPDE